MEKTILFVLLPPYADWEAAYLSAWLLALGQERYAVKTVSLTKEPVRSIGGFTLLPDYDLASLPEEYEAVILIGGMSWRTPEAQRVAPLVRQALARRKVVGGICDAAAFLGKIGALNQADHTGNDLDDLKQWAGDAYTGAAHFLKQPAVRCGNLVTANGTAPLEFAREVLLALDVAGADEIDAAYRFYKLGCYEAAMP